MDSLPLALALSFGLLAAVVAGLDAARRGESWPVAALAVGGVTLLACAGAAFADHAVLSAYAALTGGPVVVRSPRAYLGVLVGVAAGVTVVVLSGYSAVTRFRRTA